jgi:type I restriction enzyme S subunit
MINLYHRRLSLEFPANWKMSKFSALFFETDERKGTLESIPLSVSEYHGVVPRNESAGQKESVDTSHYRMVHPGQLAANMMWLNRGGLGVSNHTGHISPAYKAFSISPEMHPIFAHYLLRSPVYISAFESLGQGVRPNSQMVDSVDLAGLTIPLPDLPTQRRIADYLDRETAQIDAMAGALDGLVARLEERYARVVEEGTRLDIPHLPLGYCASIYNGSTPSRSRTDFWRDTPGVAWLNSSAVNQVPVTCPSRYVTDTAISECHLPEVRRGDLLMGITGQGRTRGMVSISSIPGTISQHVASIRLNERAHPRFMFWVLKSHYGTIRMNSEGAGSTKGAVTLDEIKRISVPLPPLDEQRRIADHLDAETAKIDAMIAKAGELRALLDERRSALITATVTGQHPVPEEP